MPGKFNTGDRCHLYIKGWEVYEAEVTEEQGDVVTVKFHGGHVLIWDAEHQCIFEPPKPNPTTYIEPASPRTLSNINISAMYPDSNKPAVFQTSDQLADFTTPDNKAHTVMRSPLQPCHIYSLFHDCGSTELRALRVRSSNA